MGSVLYEISRKVDYSHFTSTVKVICRHNVRAEYVCPCCGACNLTVGLLVRRIRKFCFSHSLSVIRIPCKYSQECQISNPTTLSVECTVFKPWLKLLHSFDYLLQTYLLILHSLSLFRQEEGLCHVGIIKLILCIMYYKMTYYPEHLMASIN